MNFSQYKSRVKITKNQKKLKSPGGDSNTRSQDILLKLQSCDSMIDIVLIVWRLVFMFTSMNIVTIF